MTETPLETLTRLQSEIASRRHADPSQSYVASLFEKGPIKMGRKVAEEALEVAIAAVAEGRRQVVSESADLVFHLLVLLEYKEISLEEVLGELARRQGTSGLDEKKNRKK